MLLSLLGQFLVTAHVSDPQPTRIIAVLPVELHHTRLVSKQVSPLLTILFFELGRIHLEGLDFLADLDPYRTQVQDLIELCLLNCQREVAESYQLTKSEFSQALFGLQELHHQFNNLPVVYLLS